MPKIDHEPIIVVMPDDSDFKDKTNSPRDAEPLCDVTKMMRSEFSLQVSSVSAAFKKSFQASPNIPAVAKVKLKKEAIVKSYKPTTLFDERSCPIIGSNVAGEIFVSASPSGLSSLDDRIQNGNSKKVRTNISALSSISPYTDNDASQVKVEKKCDVRVRLFRHDSATINTRIDSAFSALAVGSGIDAIADIPYSDSMRVYHVKNVDAPTVRQLSRFVGTQSVTGMPEYGVVKTASRIIGSVTPKNFPPPVKGRKYGVVGVIDSGSSPSNTHLQKWIIDRYSLVPESQQDNGHGSFVCGLIANSRALNHGELGFPSDQAKIVDVVAIDKTGRISEAQLLFAIDDAIRRFPQVKVWNLSLALSEPVSDTSMSLLGVALDERRKKHGVLFVTPTGNTTPKVPMRKWPAPENTDDHDRMSPPGDSHSSITVGGLAHTALASSVVKKDQPSPFVCRGIGFGGQIKPEIVCYAGNADANGGSSQMGVLSLNSEGSIAENIGVSFAVPQVSTVAANVHQSLVTEPANPTLVKGLITHSAFMRSKPLKPDHVAYFGLGKLLSSPLILNCKKSAATMILNVPVRTDPQFKKYDFPMPSCLESESGLACEVFMTLIYDPPIKKGFGLEYCRTTIKASLGTVAFDPETGAEKYTRQVEPSPKGFSTRLESDISKLGFEWSPLKLYYRKFSRGPVGKQWRLSLSRTDRAEGAFKEPQDATVIITIRSLSRDSNVHKELVEEMSRLQWQFRNLKVQQRVRVR